MHEYRLSSLPTSLKKKLVEQHIDIIEEKFNQRKSWLLYVKSSLDKLLETYEVEYTRLDVSDTGWDELWRNYLEDGWLTDKVYYCFEKKRFRDKRRTIRINPALAFGTGSHATTQIAARLLEGVAKGQTVFDIGTGSGILSILASIAGAKKVFACDIDAVAVMNAKENVGLNKCDNIYLWAGGIESFDPHARPSVVVANIITSVLTPLHPHIQTLRPKYIIYSGILNKEGESFFSSLDMHGYQPDNILRMKEWCGIRLKMT